MDTTSAAKPPALSAASHTITVSFDPSAGYTYVDSSGANAKHQNAKKGDTVTWQIGTGIGKMELYFTDQNSPFGSRITTCKPGTPFKITGGIAAYEYITIITDPQGNLIPPDDPEIILDGGLIPDGAEMQVAAAQAGVNLVFNVRIGG